MLRIVSRDIYIRSGKHIGKCRIADNDILLSYRSVEFFYIVCISSFKACCCASDIHSAFGIDGEFTVCTFRSRSINFSVVRYQQSRVLRSNRAAVCTGRINRTVDGDASCLCRNRSAVSAINSGHINRTAHVNNAPALVRSLSNGSRFKDYFSLFIDRQTFSLKSCSVGVDYRADYFICTPGSHGDDTILRGDCTCVQNIGRF